LADHFVNEFLFFSAFLVSRFRRRQVNTDNSTISTSTISISTISIPPISISTISTSPISISTSAGQPTTRNQHVAAALHFSFQFGDDDNDGIDGGNIDLTTDWWLSRQMKGDRVKETKGKKARADQRAREIRLFSTE
jgi:hypothetical protein